jgi:tripartite-type tricarboxylate transporter receptor subunit TctC
MKPVRWWLIGSAAIAALWCNTAQSETVAQFYSHTPIRLIISADAGGSYDAAGRLVARHLGNHIPGHPKIIPENMLGASGRVATSYIYNSAPKDGSVIGCVQQSIPMAQALHEKGVRYDAAKLNWIGSPVRPDETLVVWYATGVKTIDDAKKKTVVIGATSPTGMNFVYPKLANELLGTKFKIITGYPGGTPINLAIERGEVEGRGSNGWDDWKIEHPEWVKEKKIIPILQMSLQKAPDLPNVPLLVDLAPNETDRKIFELVSITGELGRPLVAPPGVPAERLAALRKGFSDTMKDPEFLADAAKLKKTIEPIEWQETEDLVHRALSVPPEAVALLKSALAAGGKPERLKKPAAK